MFQRLPDGYEVLHTLGDIRFTGGQTEVVYFNQLDERYANKPYGTDTEAISSMRKLLRTATSKMINIISLKSGKME